MVEKTGDTAVADVATTGNEPWRANLGRMSASELEGERPDWWWTGPKPGPGAATSLPLPNLHQLTREGVLAYFDNSWQLTEILFSGLQGEEPFYRPPYHNLRHPLIFYYGHPASLYVNKLRVAGLLDQPLNAEYETILETGVDEMSWDDLSKNEMLWPTVREVRDYRARVYATVRKVIETHPGLDGRPVTIDDPLWALFLGFEHERIHLETSTVLIRELPVGLLKRPAQWPADCEAVARPAPETTWVAREASVATLGKPRGWPSFGWDNEYGRREVQVPDFEATRDLISNADFAAFIEAGGYREPRFWSPEGWNWRTFRNAKWPCFWVKEGPTGLHQFNLRTIFEVIPMQPAWPALVNFYEAKAYCAWRTEVEGSPVPYRLLTEAEHQQLRDTRTHDPKAGPSGDPVMRLSGAGLAAAGQNSNLAYGSEGPVDGFALSSAGFHDAYGNAWQWCEDPFHPLPGFAMHPYYEDFSQPCFDGKHQMILGGSFASTGDEASIWSRFHFRPHFFQHAGFRMVRSQAPMPIGRLGAEHAGSAVYESAELIGQYLGLHFGAVEDQMPYAFGPREAVDFPRRCAELVLDAAKQRGAALGRALDLGCATGGSSFGLARGYEEVVGIDLSNAFIDAAKTLKAVGRLGYALREEGDLELSRVATVPADIRRERVSFLEGDACNLPEDLGDFDALLMANLLCRLPSPAALLDRLPSLVRPGGLLVLVSPYSWLEAFTPRDQWPGGLVRDGKVVRTSDALRERLGADFTLLEEQEVPLVIREHARKYQYIVSHGMVWQRHSR